jgi:hypothetical protein
VELLIHSAMTTPFSSTSEPGQEAGRMVGHIGGGHVGLRLVESSVPYESSALWEVGKVETHMLKPCLQWAGVAWS